MKRYTVKQVSNLSGVSVRALHFYDEIGLLRPASYGENGYRYYEQEQLFLLQQILFYRKLGFPLERIQEIVSDPGFDKITALKNHKSSLEKDATRLEDLIRTIDKTIASLQGRETMKDKELYFGFAPEKQKEYERYLIDRGGKAVAKNIEESKQRVKGWKKEDWDRVSAEGDKVNRGLVDLIEKGTSPSHAEVQALIQLHYQWICHFWTPNRESYTALGHGYTEHPDFGKFYDRYHPRLVDFLAEAIRLYAESRL